MSSNDKLQVHIGADKSEFDKKLQEVEQDIKDLSKIKLDRLKLGLDTAEINSNIKSAKDALRTLKDSAKDTGQAFTKDLAPKVANGGNALMQFSRIAQDAPFGIMGIGNNITATAEAFASLKNQTGSTGGALKALASSLAGTGGLLLGVSLLTTGLTLLAQSGLSVGDVIDKIRGKFNSFSKDLQKVTEEAAKQSGGEIANMKALVSVAQDDTLSRQQRLIAVKQLQDTFPAYFGNLKQEQILNGNVTTAVNEVSKALIARATATALAGKLGELASKRIALEQQREQDILDIQKQQLYIKKQLEKGTNSTKGISAEEFTRINLKALTDQYKETQKEIRDLDAESQKYAERENEATKRAILLLQEKDKVLKGLKETPQVTAVQNLLTPAPITIPKPLGEKDFKDSFIGLANTVSEETARMLAALNSFNQQANNIIQNSIAQTFAGLGSAIGNAVATGGNILEAVGASLLSSLGGILTQMGQMAIQIGVSLIAIKFALKSLNPAVAIGAGVALIALGSFFSSKSASISGGIGGGGASSSSGSGANNSNFTSSSFSGGGGGGTVVFEISGQKLIGVLSNTIGANRRLGGSLGIG